jgi:hypothetical protein
MGINSAADKWKWVAIHTMDSIIPRTQHFFDTITPRTQVLLDRLNEAVEPGAIKLLVKNIDGAISMTCLTMFFFLVFVSVIMWTSFSLRKDRYYVHDHYGCTIDSRARTYVNLMKHHSERVRRVQTGVETKRTNVLLIGVNEVVEAYIRHEPSFASDSPLQALLPTGISFTFGSIKDALHTLDTYCTEKMPTTLFIFLLISSRDPSRGYNVHEAFEVPSGLRNHCYAIVGTGGKDGFAHRLSGKSKGPNGEPLEACLLLGLKDVGVCL